MGVRLGGVLLCGNCKNLLGFEATGLLHEGLILKNEKIHILEAKVVYSNHKSPAFWAER